MHTIFNLFVLSTTTVLARKWRPKNFTQLTGQTHVVQALSNALAHNRLHHAYLFTGTRGVGKTTIARIFAKSLNCIQGISAEPCGECQPCREIDSGRFIDLIELDAASNTQVDSMRELLENALYAPTSGRFKVYIIDEVHMLSRSAFNAMLKTLEEPPLHVKFILATTDPQKIPVTVLSRCLQFNLKQLSPSLINQRLNYILGEENIAFETPALQLIARAAHGSMRDALSLLDQAIAFSSGSILEQEVRNMLGAVDRDYLFKLLAALTEKDGSAMLDVADDMATRSIVFDAALQELASLLHRIALIQTIPQAIAEEDLERNQLLEFATQFSAEELQLYYQIVIHGRNEINLAPDEYAGFTMTLLRLLAFTPSQSRSQTQSNLHLTAQTKPAATPVARPVAKKEIAAPIAQQETSPPEPKHVAKPTPVTTKPSVLLNTDNSNWAERLNQLNLQGMALQLAKHCNLEQQDQNQLTLKLSNQFKHLKTRLSSERLEAALKEYYGTETVVRIVLGDSQEQATPAQQEQQTQEQKQKQAEQLITQDQFVQDAQKQLGATIIPDSIKPN